MDFVSQPENDETGICERCGAVAGNYGPDPYRSEMCDTYARYPSTACEPGCDCWDEMWLCDDCHYQSLMDI